MPKSPSARETEYEFYVRAATDHARMRRRQRHAHVMRTLTSWRRRTVAPDEHDNRGLATRGGR